MDKELINALSIDEKTMFYDYTERYDRCSSNHKYRAAVDVLLEEWDKQKTALYEVFGRQFILSKEINCTKSDDELYADLQPWFNSRTCNAMREWVTTYCKRTNETGLSVWEHPLHNKLSRMLNDACFFKNKYQGPDIDIPIPGTENVFQVRDGIKMMKLIRKLYNKFGFMINLDEDELEQDIVLYSQCTNQKIVKGNLCLSIHPLDFITASDNNNGWDSCMTYCGEGDYRRGIIEMMNSPIVVCAYLTGSVPYCEDGLEWNSKKWREFFIVRDDIISGIKGYPYWSQELEEIVINWLTELMEAYYKISYGDMIKFQPDHRDANGNSFKMSTRGHAMYNDFYNGNEYMCRITPAFDYEVITYPGTATCMFCGEARSDSWFHSTSAVVCTDCGDEEDSCCELCGDYCRTDDMTEVDGEYWCDYCVEQHANYSEVDHMYHHAEDVWEVALASRERQKIYWSHTFRYWNCNNYCFDNNFARIPYPIYDAPDSSTQVVFIEDIKAIDNGKTFFDWVWCQDMATLEKQLLEEENKKGYGYVETCNVDELELLHEGNKVTA